VDPARARIVRIRSTLSLGRFVASEAYAADVPLRSDLTVLTPPRAWPLTPAGDFDAASDLLAESAGR
jgi:hypothetical protein